jgi:hypothetical protein
MEETDPAAGEAKGQSPSPDQEEVGNVLRLPVETSSEDTAHEGPPEPKPQGHHFTVVSSFGSAAREIAAPEIVAQEGLPSQDAAPESAAPESVAAQEVGPEESGPAESENVSPELKDLLDIAAVQAAVDAIVDAAVRGSSDEFD